MNKLPLFALAISVVLATGGAAVAANNKANPNAPGQDRVCLVTSGNPGSFNDVDIVATKWLPRKAAQAQASKDPTTMLVKDYSTDPLVGTKYASAEELCKTHFQ